MVDLYSFNLPKIEEVIRRLHNKKYFSVLDLEDGYFQVILEDKDKENTAFLDDNVQLMQFTRMPQSLKNALALFQRRMSFVLKGLFGITALGFFGESSPVFVDIRHFYLLTNMFI